MQIEFEKLTDLSVETQSGLKLGKVKDIILETEGQSILQYEVSSLLGKKYLISREQVLQITVEKIVVEDNIVSEEARVSAEQQKKIKIEPEGVVMDKSV